MPHPDYRYQARVLLACSAADAHATQGEGPRGKFVSKAQTRLQYAVADIRAWEQHLSGGTEAGVVDAVGFHLLLDEALVSDVAEGVAEAVERLDFHHDESNGGSLNVVFSGHGYENGDLALRDGPLPIDQLMEWCAAGRAGEGGKTRHLRVVIDACYAGQALARMLLHPHHWTKVVLRDAFASCLPSEESFELDRLGHSVFTHTMVNRYANLLPPPVGQGDWSQVDYREYVRAQRETTQYLTGGRQHALDVVNGHHVSIAKGRDRFLELEDGMRLDQLGEALDNLAARRR